MAFEPDLSRLIEENLKFCEELRQNADLYEIAPEFDVSLNPHKPLNKLIYGDNLLASLVLRREKPGYQLIYIDPPYASNSNYNLKLSVGEKNEKVRVPVYSDIWRNGLYSYLSMLFPRLFFMRELLRNEGAIFVHVDTKASHYVKVLMDCVFGSENFVNEIIYRKDAGQRVTGYFPRKHDVILFYARDIDKLKFNAHAPLLRTEYNKIAVKMHFKPDENQRLMREYESGKRFYKDLGKLIDDIWGDISTQQATSPIMSETTGFETQKPTALLQRIIAAVTDSKETYREKRALHEFLQHKKKYSSGFEDLGLRKQDVIMHNWTNEFFLKEKAAWVEKIDDKDLPDADVIADFFAGSGTTGITAQQMQRNFVLCEVDRTAWFVSLKRVLQNQDTNLRCLKTVKAEKPLKSVKSKVEAKISSEKIEILKNPLTLNHENIENVIKSKFICLVKPPFHLNSEHQKRNSESYTLLAPVFVKTTINQDSQCLCIEIPEFVNDQLRESKQNILAKHNDSFIFDFCLVQSNAKSEIFQASHAFMINKVSDTIYQIPETLNMLNLIEATFCVFDIFGNMYLAHSPRI